MLIYIGFIVDGKIKLFMLCVLLRSLLFFCLKQLLLTETQRLSKNGVKQSKELTSCHL